LTIKNTARPSGRNYGGQNYYDWTAYIDGPLALLRQAIGVQYFLHPSFPQPVIEIRQGLEYGFPLSTNGWGEFTLRAKILFQDGTTRDLSHPLQLFSR
jgi:transcription initiation factor IIF auxiliary subunit